MRIVSTPKNHLPKLKEIQAKIKSKSISKEEKQHLALEAVKLVLPIWEVYYKDDRPRLAIQIAEECLNNPTEENRKKAKEAVDAANAAAYVAYVATNVVAYYVADAAYYVAYSVYTYSVSDAIYSVYYAIKATKEFFKIK